MANAHSGRSDVARHLSLPQLPRCLVADYLATVERLAQRLRPRFESGDLRWYDDGDGKAWNQLEREIEKDLVPTSAVAYTVLALSPSEDLALESFGGCVDDAQALAAAVLALDVLRIARGRGWYRPTA